VKHDAGVAEVGAAVEPIVKTDERLRILELSFELCLPLS